MKQRTLFFGLLILLGCAFLLFTGCPTAVTDDAAGYALARAAIGDPPPVFTEPLRLNINDGPVYYDLATGEEVDPEEEDWDFGVEYQWGQEALKGSGLVFFYTNSEDSGEGDGAVWFTGETDFSLVQSFDDAVDPTGTEYEPYVTDVNRFAYGMGGNVYETPMNMMTYFGFPGGDGSEEYPFTVNPYAPPIETYKFYNFDKMAAYTDRGNMPPNLAPTGQVYIIRHHGGATYSKLQVSKFALGPTQLYYTMTITFTEIPYSPSKPFTEVE
jgi:hypothetical protein